MLNAFIKVKTNSKKLQFGESKCKKLHVGKYSDEIKCKKISVDTWKELKVFNEDIGVDVMEKNIWKRKMRKNT